MVTFAMLAALPFVLVAAQYFIISRLAPATQDQIISTARYRSR